MEQFRYDGRISELLFCNFDYVLVPVLGTYSQSYDFKWKSVDLSTNNKIYIYLSIYVYMSYI